MLNKLFIIINILSLFLTINTFAQNQDDKLAIIKNKDYIEWLTSKDFEIWYPNSSELVQIEEILLQAIRDDKFNFLKTKRIVELKKKYYRQYLCYTNESGEKIVYINSMCELFTDYDKDNKPIKFDWKTKMVDVSDGGECYWNIKINLTNKTYFDLIINGYG